VAHKGFVLVAEPVLPELKENYVMVFRPATEAEWNETKRAYVGAGWVDKPVPAATPNL